MQLSLFSDYSLRVLIYGALKGESFRVDEVSRAYGISRHHLAKVVQRLARLGYLATRRGRGGGLELALPAAEVRLGALVRATEVQAVLVECFDPLRNTCPINGVCRLKGFLAEAQEAFYQALDRHTLCDLVRGSARPGLEHLLLRNRAEGSLGRRRLRGRSV
ncbi:MAG: Rrf2 family transcriptional regulator [Verrucomicrobia bacterium]|nr:Rrf2 family transcriptional regulator [Verrucomicrobiota bacterium]